MSGSTVAPLNHIHEAFHVQKKKSGARIVGRRREGDLNAKRALSW